jgi:flagellar hook-associated protein 3
MNLRITPQVQVDTAISNLQQQTGQITTLEQEASSGNRINRPSDDPIGTIALIASQEQDNRLTTYLGNIQDATNKLDLSNSTLVSAGNVLSQAKEVAIEASNSSNDTTSFEALAQQVDGFLNQLLNLANTQDQGHYIFGGTASTKPPFAVTSQDALGRPQSVAYAGSQDSAQETINQHQTIATYYAGSQIFQATTRGPTLFSGVTGAGPGTGRDTATGQGSLLVAHTSTVYASGSGIQPGTGTAGDTVLGPAGANSLTLVDTSGNGSAGTVSLNGGPAVAFTNADTNLKVTGPKGEVVYLNTTAIAPNFNGAVAITGNGSLSIDGGATTQPIDFTSPDQVLVDSKTGAVTNVDSRGIRQAGTDTLTYSGPDDAFQALLNLRDDIRNVHGLPAAQQLQVISADIGNLDRARGNVLNAVGAQSANLQNLSAIQSRLQEVQLNTKQQTGNIQGADISQVVIGLTEQQNLLRLTLDSVARIFSQSLLDYIK